MRYEDPVFRPPSEAGSLLIQATIGCPHNKCAFCGMYKMKKFRVRKVDEIKEDLDMARDNLGQSVRAVCLAYVNSRCMKTKHLVEILKYTRKLFPELERITMYGAAKFIVLKKLEEWKQIRNAGLDRIHAGLETGDDVLLEKICKGSDSKTAITAGKLIKEAGIQLSEYVLIGIGGKEHTKEHALNTAKALSAIDPDFIRLRTFVPMKRTPIYEEYESGKFQLLTPHEALTEIKTILENLTATSLFVSDHVSNFANIEGKLPGDKPQMLGEIEHNLKRDRSEFRPDIIRNL